MNWLAVGLGALFLWWCMKDDSRLTREVLAPLGGWVAEWWRPIWFGWVSAVGLLVLVLLPRKVRVVILWLGAAGAGLLVILSGLVLLSEVSPRQAVVLLLLLPVLGAGTAYLFRGGAKGGGSVCGWIGTLRVVIGRELRSQSRRTFTYWGRVVGVAALLTVSCLFFIQRELRPGQGGEFFEVLHLFVIGAAAALVPFITADCVSRERREGTLDLLFLSSLRPGQIALAKWVAHGLKTGGFYLALAPVLAIPILAGGVSWQDVVLSVTVTFLVIGWMLAVGVMTSSLGRTATEALLSACVVGGTSVLVLMLSAGFGMTLFEFAVADKPEEGFAALNMGRAVENAFWFFRGSDRMCCGAQMIIFKPGYFWPGLASALVLPVAGLALWLKLAGVCMGQSLWLNLPFTSVVFQWVWGEKKSAPKDDALSRDFRVPPVGLALGRRWLKGLRERDPIGWLGRRDSAACGLSWISLAAVMVCTGVILVEARRLDMPMSALAWILIGATCLMAAGGFRRERQTGMLELLMVTPLREREVLNGFLRGMWAQARPAAVLLWGLWGWRMATSRIEEEDRDSVYLLATLVAVPVVGFYFSLRLRHYLGALVGTVLVAVLLPLIVGDIASLLRFGFGADGGISLVAVQSMRLFVLLLVTIPCYLGLRWMLKQRQFTNAET